MNSLSSNKTPHDFYHKEMLDFAKGLSCIGHVISIFAFIYAVNYIYSFPYVSLEWSNVTMTNIFLIQKIWNYLIYFTLLLCISDILSYILFFISFIFVVTLSSLVSGQYWLCKSLEASLSFLLWKKICTGVNFFGDIIKFFSEIIWHWRILVVRIFIIAFFSKTGFSVYHWLSWNQLCWPAWPWIQRSTYPCLPSVGGCEPPQPNWFVFLSYFTLV